MTTRRQDKFLYHRLNHHVFNQDGDWPEDFDEVELDAEKTYLDAVEHKGAGE